MAGHCLGWCSGDHVSGTDIYTHTMLTVFERSQSSTYRELVTILFVLVSLAQLMFVSRVKWFTDSQGAARIIQVGSMHFNLHNLASDFFFFALSKIIDYDDWEVVPQIFHLLDGRWGPHTVDCFATFYNYKVPRFFSRFWNPGFLWR